MTTGITLSRASTQEMYSKTILTLSIHMSHAQPSINMFSRHSIYMNSQYTHWSSPIYNTRQNLVYRPDHIQTTEGDWILQCQVRSGPITQYITCYPLLSIISHVNTIGNTVYWCWVVKTSPPLWSGKEELSTHYHLSIHYPPPSPICIIMYTIPSESWWNCTRYN